MAALAAGVALGVRVELPSLILWRLIDIIAHCFWLVVFSSMPRSSDRLVNLWQVAEFINKPLNQNMLKGRWRNVVT